MNETKWTPGPWSVIRAEVTGPVWTIVGCGIPVADIPEDSAISEANARLIAKAPEMYEALNMLGEALTSALSVINSETDDDNAYPKTREAIAEAQRVRHSLLNSIQNGGEM